MVIKKLNILIYIYIFSLKKETEPMRRVQHIVFETKKVIFSFFF